jgi:hypothetical protein
LLAERLHGLKTRGTTYNRLVVRPSDDNLSSGAGDDFVDDAMLADAIVKAKKLVAEMEKQQREIDDAPPRNDLSPQQLADGKLAFENAIASARRMLKALEDAHEIARQAQQDEPDPHDAN